MKSPDNFLSVRKSINSTPIPFVPLVVIGIVVGMYVNSMSGLSFYANESQVKYGYHMALSIVLMFLLYVYYSFSEILTEFDSIIKYSELIKNVRKLERRYYDQMFFRLLLIVLYLCSWFGLKDSCQIIFFSKCPFLSPKDVLLAIFSFVLIVFVLEFPLVASLTYYQKKIRNKIGNKKQPKKESMLDSSIDSNNWV